MRVVVFKPMENDVEEAKTNCAMMGKVAYAMNQLSPRLKSFVYSGGTRVKVTFLY